MPKITNHCKESNPVTDRNCQLSPNVVSLSSLSNRTLKFQLGIWPPRKKRLHFPDFLAARQDQTIDFCPVVFKGKRHMQLPGRDLWEVSHSLLYFASSYSLDCGHDGRNRSSHLGRWDNRSHGGPARQSHRQKKPGCLQTLWHKAPMLPWTAYILTLIWERNMRVR